MITRNILRIAGSYCIGIHCILMAMSVQAMKIPKEELDPAFWFRSGESELREALERKWNTNIAKNVILFLADGMGMSTVTASRIFKGQLRGKPGEETRLSFERFPNIALAKTYNVDHQVADSAATATAFLCGVKSIYGTVGLDSRVHRGECRGIQDKNLTCIAEMAQNAGKATGFVTTSRVTHATPAPLYAASPDRLWESDHELPEFAKGQGCTDIASQLLLPVGKQLNVIMGGGRGNMIPVTEKDPEKYEKSGKRRDGRNLIEEWVGGSGEANLRTYIWNYTAFSHVDVDKIDNLLGLFAYDHMSFDKDRQCDPGGEPSLSEMVEKAIGILRNNPKGYFLLVEAARIDHAHHGNTARLALEEMIALDEAVQVALTLTNTDETLVIVTADHSHPLSIGSYATRGNPILGLTDYVDDDTKKGLSDVDGLPLTTLNYANGPGYDFSSPRKNLTNTNTENRSYRQVTAVPQRVVSHDATDVPIYALGPMSHLFHSTHEQHYIFHAMVHAACMSPDQRHCLPQQTCSGPDNTRCHSYQAAASVSFAAKLNNRTLYIYLAVLFYFI